ncbi:MULTISPECIES: energy transducer TonB [Luteimonas]|uniref:energy transducer TonB n=1 Tax=Luteimonas TaxID=83614 RepID=UPI00117DAFE6|nr:MULTISPECIES: energy transducer TonB [Luteimonas]
MSESSPTPHWRQTLSSLLPTRRAWGAIAAACGLGLLLFVALWLGNRPTGTTADDSAAAPTATAGRTFEPLPAPLPAASEGTGRGGSTTTSPSPVRIDEHVPRTAPVASPSEAATMVDATVTPVPVPVAADVARQPRPISTPAPDYPRTAMRRGEAGEVLLRVHVDADGRTSAVDLVRSSQHRRLDRAATQAVRRWRFEPAMRDGRPVPGELLVPFQFTPATQ